MKITILTTDFEPTKGGIATLTKSLGLHLSQSSDVELVRLCAYKNKFSDEFLFNKKFFVKRIKTKFLVQLFWKVQRDMILYKDTDIFHSTNIFPLGFFAVVVGKLLGKSVVVSYYGTDLLTNHGSLITKWAKKFTLVHATKSIALGNNTRKLVAQKLGLQENNSAVISYALPDYEPVDTGNEIIEIKKEFGILDDDFVVLYVGNLIPRKGCVDLFDAVASCNDSKVKLIFVGTGVEEQELRDKAKKNKLEDRIFFAGRRGSLSPFYDMASVFSMPSYYDTTSGDIEGLGIVFLEAAQHELPSVATNSGGIPDAIEDGVTGFLVPERNITAIREKILFFKNNPDIRDDMGNKAKIFVQEKFNWRKSVSEHVKLYKSLT